MHRGQEVSIRYPNNQHAISAGNFKAASQEGPPAVFDLVNRAGCAGADSHESARRAFAPI